MYRSCIFCSADLGSNESIEQFPVGRSLAFDAAKGRLWAVCPKCARWNLAPIEERWEAIEAGERLFRDSRMRAQSENVGMAKLRDGTRLIRVGAAVGAELATWRYGNEFARRATWHRWRTRASDRVVPHLGAVALLLLGPLGIVAGSAAMAIDVWARSRTGDVPLHLRPGVVIRRRHMVGAYLEAAPENGLLLHVPLDGSEWGTVRDADAAAVLSRGLVGLNAAGASRETLEEATAILARAASPTALLQKAASQNLAFHASWQQMLHRAWKPGHGPRYWIERAERQGIPFERQLIWQRVADATVGSSPLAVALEMALHEETERRALEGELTMLEAMWREAEEIAGIADRLPDHLPASAPPQL